MTEAKPAPSPYFSGTTLQYAWDNTSMGTLQACPRKYQLSILEGWRQKDKSRHLVFGGHYATAMEHFFKHRAAGLSYDEALEAVIEEALAATWLRTEENPDGAPWDSEDTKKSRETLIRSIIWYFETYRNDTVKTLSLSDGTPAVELSFAFESGHGSPFANQPYLMTGHLDRVVDFDGTIYVMDQKTTGGALGSYYFSGYDLDSQMSQYTFASKVAFNFPVKGVIIDAAQIMVGFTAFGRGITMRSAGQLEEWHENFGYWLHLAEHFAETQHYPMNLQSCGNYGGCAFKNICNKDPAVRNTFLETDFEKRYWNPLEAR